jgi:hypothetical protein
MASLLFLTCSTAEANYWGIAYAPHEVGVLRGSDVNPGDADDIESVLSAMGCLYVTVDPDDLAGIADDSSVMKVLFVEGSPVFFKNDVNWASAQVEQITRLIAFVSRGGQLFVTGKADFLIDTLGAGYGVGMYMPSRPAEEFTGSANVVMDTFGSLKNYLQTSSITLSYPVLKKYHSVMDLESVSSPGSETEMTGNYVYRYIEVSGGVADWAVEMANLVTSLIFPRGSNDGTVHYVNYNLYSAYNSSGQNGKNLVEYQVANILRRAGLVPEEMLGQYAGAQDEIADRGRIEADSSSHYTYKPGRGTVSFSPGDPQTTLKIGNLHTLDDLSVYRTDDDMHLSVTGAAGDVKIPGWFTGRGGVSAIELSGGELIPASYLSENAIAKEPDIDITPVSVDRRVVPGAGQIDVTGGRENDYIFGNSMDNTLYGKGGSNIYYYRLGEGSDTIVNEKDGTAVNVLRFHMDITSNDIAVSKEGDDLRFTLAGGGVTVKDWYAKDAAKLDRVEIYDGTYWDVRDLEKLADGKTLLPRGSVINPVAVEANTSAGEGDRGSGCSSAMAGWMLLLALPLSYSRLARRR